jgi:predicted DNA-binding mobile mystery protein A
MKPLFLNDTTFAQINRRLESLRAVKETASVRDGWIHYMRTALGLTLSELGKLVSLSTATVAQAERREVDGQVNLSTLKKMAEAMDCDLVYAFVPKKEMKTLIHDKAFAKARKILGLADLHMKLENQKVTGDEKERIERLAKTFIEKGDIW